MDSTQRPSRNRKYWARAGFTKDARELADIAADHPDWADDRVVAWLAFERYPGDGDV